jgi:hypothetical protein
VARECVDLIVNGDFEDGLTGWEFDGEVKLRFGDLGGGRYAPMLLGRNSVEAEMSQTVTVPGDAESVYVSYWWRSVSSEPIVATKAYDTLDSEVSGQGPTVVLETLSNLTTRDEWLPSGYNVSDEAGPLEIAFRGSTNPRDPTEMYVDLVKVVACTGGRAEFPSVGIDPASGPSGTLFVATSGGFEPGESVTGWLLDPKRLRRDIGTVPANATGIATHSFEAEASWQTGQYGFGVIGQTSLVPGGGSFDLSALSDAARSTGMYQYVKRYE